MGLASLNEFLIGLWIVLLAQVGRETCSKWWKAYTCLQTQWKRDAGRLSDILFNIWEENHITFLKLQYDGHCQFIIFTGLKPFYAECSSVPDKTLWEYFKHDDGKSIAQYKKGAYISNSVFLIYLQGSTKCEHGY